MSDSTAATVLVRRHSTIADAFYWTCERCIRTHRPQPGKPDSEHRFTRYAVALSAMYHVLDHLHEHDDSISLMIEEGT